MADNHRRVGHEERDVNFFSITKFGIGLTILVVVSVFVMWGLFAFFDKRIEAGLPPAPETRAAPEGKLPPQPRLQRNPRIDLRALSADEDKLLHSYGWIDKEKGVARIPVERAMDILAQRGLPARPAEEGAK